MKTIGLLSVCVLLIAIKQTSSLPAPSDLPQPPVPPLSSLSSQILEFIINPNRTQLECSVIDEDIPNTQSGMIPVRYRWQNFYVFIDPEYNDNERNLINYAMNRLAQVLPCVRFGIWPIGSTPSGDYVHIKKLNGCFSAIGKQGGGQQMSLQSPDCMWMDTILHEMIHTLGFDHEQSRPDRDDFVTVQFQNVIPGKERNFIKHSYGQVSTFNVGYDQQSIMHYDSTDFSRNGQPTIVAKDGGAIGSTGDLRQSDILKLKRMYKC
ncbi:unnamed protein product [Orchesella dallaii]|uniref:Metalloendopeptidase n=1 Tax=Orchesella dallaii TaxID=48710 RepID=A0ABP1Q773_9HEXA